MILGTQHYRCHRSQARKVNLLCFRFCHQQQHKSAVFPAIECCPLPHACLYQSSVKNHILEITVCSNKHIAIIAYMPVRHFSVPQMLPQPLTLLYWHIRAELRHCYSKQHLLSERMKTLMNGSKSLDMVPSHGGNCGLDKMLCGL